MKYEDILKANESIKTTKLKNEKTGKELGDYVEVNQRIKAFRMLYPEGRIETELLYDTNGKCCFKAFVFRNVEDEKPIATGTAYEKEDSSFINKTSYIENCETSAVGRALGMAGYGIDKSVASADEVINAINNQEMTEEEAKNYVFTFGKYKGKKIEEVPENYIDWLVGNSSDERVLKAIELTTGKRPMTEEENREFADLQIEFAKLASELELKDKEFNREIYFDNYGTKQLTAEQYKEAVKEMKDALEGLDE